MHPPIHSQPFYLFPSSFLLLGLDDVRAELRPLIGPLSTSRMEDKRKLNISGPKTEKEILEYSE